MIRQAYTLRQVAEIISGSKDPETIRRVSRQVRHWTAEDIVPAIGGKHQGTGTHRRYDEDAVRRAAVTAELVRYGITITALDPLGEYFDTASQSPNWRKAVLGECDVFLTHHIDGVDEGQFVGSLVCPTERNPLALVQAWENSDYGAGKLNVMGFASVLAINLTKLFARLRLDVSGE